METSGVRARNVEISVEKLLEQEIEEISRSGEEKYKKPLTLSEELTDLAHKIDFGEEKEIEEEKEEDEESTENKTDQFKPKKWPWDSVRNKIRNALSEVCVLLDVLQVMHEKKYLVLEPVSQNPEPPKQAVQMIGKRKSLAKAAEVIRLGAERISQNEEKQKNDFTELPVLKTDYFSELMKLRQKWRIKKTGNSITGDLSYKSAGSKFRHPGLFEVKKTQDIPEEDRDDSGCPLTVRVSPDLDGYSRVRVTITDLREEGALTNSEGGDDIKMAKATASNEQNTTQSASKFPDISPWQRKLKQAQFNLFCKELFSQISREAFQSPNLYSAEINGNTIKLQLTKDAYATIIYDNGKEDETYSYESVISGLGNVFEYRLQQLLHEKHMKQVDTPTPRPSTAVWLNHGQTVGSYHEFLAKKNAMVKQSEQCLLESFVDELKHIILRKRTNQLLDRLSTEFFDPYISTTWSAQSGPKSSYVTIHLISKRRRLAHRTSYHLTVGIEQLKLIDMDGNVVALHGRVDELETYFKTQVSVHFTKVALGIFEQFDWTIVQHPNNLAAGVKDGLRTSIVARAPTDNCTITLSVSDNHSVEVHLQKSLADSKDNQILSLLDAKFTKLEGKAEKLDWSSQHGNTFVEKLYGVVAKNCPREDLV